MKRGTLVRSILGTGLAFGLALSTPTVGSAAPERGVVFLQSDDGARVRLYRESHAILIGNSDYVRGWSDLRSIPSELDAVRAVLVGQGFSVESHANLDAAGMRSVVEDFINRRGREPENRLLFFFAGHGHTLEKGYRREMGYLVPVDAPLPNRDRNGFLERAVSMNQVLTWARDIDAKHALFLFDSCFSGAVFEARSSPDRPRRVGRLSTQPVRQFITAGSAGETVPSTSTFTPAFVDAIEERLADLDRDGYVTGVELGFYLQRVVSESTDQTPQFGKIRDYDLRRGDFVFALGPAPAPPPPPPVLLRGNVQVNVNVPAIVYIDGERSGEARPGRPVNQQNVPTGPTDVRVEAEGYETERQQVDVEPGQWSQLVFALRRPITARPAPAPLEAEPETAPTGAGAPNAPRAVAPSAVDPDPTAARLDCDSGPLQVLPRFVRVGADDPSKCVERAESAAEAGDLPRAVAFFRQACDDGSRAGCDGVVLVGTRYYAGNGTGQDVDRAVVLYTEGCDGGSFRGCTNLGVLYEKGQGVERDLDRAATLFQRGCDGGEPVGCTSLGFLYDKGRGVVEDAARAAALFGRACDGGQALGCTSLGLMYGSGRGVELDVARAAELYRKGCDGRDALACTNLALLYSEGLGVPKNIDRAIDYYWWGCDGGEPRSCTNLGVLYQAGRGVEVDLDQAADLYRAACSRGEASGCNNLAVLYESGAGVPRDAARARELYRKACEGGSENACANR